MDTDSTFPVVAGPLPASACRQLPFHRFAAASSSPPPWFPSSPSPTAATGAPPVTTRSRALTLTSMPAAAQQQQGPPPGAGGDTAAAAAAAAVAEVEDRMDLLWEDFNEELARGGRGSCCRAGNAGGGLQQASDLWSSGSSEPAAARGCAPVLRPSSRAGGAVRHCRRRAGTWVLLMRIFTRLFVIEKTVSASAAAARRQHAAATARAS
ncbi:uncharacterized protein [Miscanthus floridulus]|uniref:uncharacterized protein n=1 Tax=Miscanthus floridulus TaxID=154761 RepID=UPI003459555B